VVTVGDSRSVVTVVTPRTGDRGDIGNCTSGGSAVTASGDSSDKVSSIGE
jgi:hypothetical protein